MDPSAEAKQKELAIETHSIQAGDFAARYEKEVDPYQNCFAYSRKRLDSLLATYLPAEGKGRRLLDVGCGTGHHMQRLAQRGYVVAGVDASEGMLAHARTNNPGARIEKADVDALPFPSADFDFVLCIEVLRYLPDPAAAINEIGRVLKPGGIALVTATPLLNLNGYAIVNRITASAKVANLTSLKQFFTTSWRLRKQFRAAGFETVEVHGVYLGPVNWVERLARPLLPRFLRGWERIDRAVSDRGPFREMTNMFLVRAVKR